MAHLPLAKADVALVFCGTTDGYMIGVEFTSNQDEGRKAVRAFKHVSTIFDLNFLRNSSTSESEKVDYIVAVGGRSEISIHSCSELRLRLLYSGCLSLADDVRLIAVRLQAEQDSIKHLRVYLLCSDGTMRCLFFNIEKCILTECHWISIPRSLSMFWRLEIVGKYYYVISTCGRLFCYIEKDTANGKEFICAKEIIVENCGLSALTVLAGNFSDMNYIFVATDSGRVFMLNHMINTDNITINSFIDAHLATITDLQGEYDCNSSFCHIYAVSTDCHTSKLRFELSSKKAKCIEHVVLSTRDPSSLLLLNMTECLIAGDGMEVVTWNDRHCIDSQ